MRYTAETRNRLGAIIRNARLEKGMSLMHLAQALKCSAGYISEIERGVKLPHPHLLYQLGELLEIDQSTLLREYFLSGGSIKYHYLPEEKKKKVLEALCD